jgi:hypothetical protein
MQGYIGIIPFSLCPMCFSGIMDMFEQLSGDVEYDNESGQEMEDDDEDSHG